MSGFAIETPWWLMACGLVLPIGLIALRWFTTMSLVRRWSALLLRAVLVALVAGALAGVSSVQTSDRLAVVAVVDLSPSVQRFGRFPGVGGVAATDPARVGDTVARYLSTATLGRTREDLLGVVVFDEAAVAVALPTAADLADRPLRSPGGEQTDLARALTYASALLPPDAPGRLLVISDGNETLGDALEAVASVAGDTGISVDVVPVPLEVGPEVVVERAASPPAAPAGSVVDVRVSLRATTPASGVLRVLCNGTELEVVTPSARSDALGARVVIPEGRSSHVLPVRLPAGRVHRFDVRFEPDTNSAGQPIGDTSPANNSAAAFTVSDDAGGVLFVSNRPGTDRIASAIASGGVNVDVVLPSAMPTSLVAYEAYDLVVLDNIPVEDAPPDGWARLERYVSSLGGGLITIGGADAYGPGGWRGSALEAMVPVSLDVPDRIVVPDAAVVFVLDSSGSMSRRVLGSSRTQQAIANESTALAIGVLAPTDLVGVIEFDSNARVVWPLRSNEDPERAQSAARSIAAGGGTVLGPALELAREQLEGSDAKMRRVIVLSDGQSEDAGSLPAIAERMAREGISLTCIAVGDDADASTMRRISEVGGGSFYQVNNADVLPQIFLKAVRVVREPLLRDEPFEPVILREGSPLLAGIGSFPVLGGLTLSSDREDGSVVRVLQTPDGFPVLAHWNAGLGVVVSFTSDSARWGEAWHAWDRFDEFWSRAARFASRPAADPRFELRVDVDGGVARVELEAIDEDGKPMDALGVAVSLFAPDGAELRVRLGQTEPGRYVAEAAASDAGVYVAVAKPVLAGKQLRPVVAGAAHAAQAEFRRLETDTALLERLAERTGGRVLDLASPGTANLFDRQGVPPKRSMTSLAPALLVWAVVVLLLDIATRRLAWDRALSSRFGEGWSGAARAQTATREARSAAALAERAPKREPALSAHETVTASAGEAPSARDVLRQRLDRERARAAEERQAAADAMRRPSDSRAADKQSTPGESPKSGNAGAGDGDEEPSGLLAAKRRARERMQRDIDDAN